MKNQVKNKSSSAKKRTKKWLLPHMQRTFKIIAKNLSFCDMILEIVDARIPLSSRSQEIHSLIRDQAKLIILNKCDLAEEGETKKWIHHFTQEKTVKWAGATNLKSLSRGQLLNSLKEVFHSQMKHKKWYQKRPLRVLIIGIPNVGKSTFINKLANKRKSAVGNVAGVTKGEQIVAIDDDLTLIDTPGALGRLTEKQSFFLMALGSIKDSNYQKQVLAEDLIEYLSRFERSYWKRFLNLTPGLVFEDKDWLAAYAKKRNFLKKKEWDLERAAEEFLYRFRNDHHFPISLERVSEANHVNDNEI